MSDVPASEFYTGLVADLYTPLKSTSFAAEPYADLIRQFGQPALELGCGDGDPLLDLRAMGLDVDGMDSSPDMLERLRRRAAGRGLEVTAWVASMESMQVERTYRTVFLAGPTFNLLPDDESMQQALHAIRGALAPEGTAVVPLFEPESAGSTSIGATTRQETPKGAIACRVVAAERDSVRRTQTLTLRYERVATRNESVTRDWLIHWVDLDRFARMAAEADLRVVSAPDAVGHEPADVLLTPA